jgi:hypothetical protein
MASITITTSGANATRVLAAIEESLGLEQAATDQDVKDYIVTDLKQLVRTSERRVAEEAANPDPVDVDIT